MSDHRVFNIGFALAGGATRGAYTAGVLDFIFQALRDLEQQRLEDPDSVPPWRVNLKTIAGTSAGGITAAIATAAIGTSIEPLSSDQNPPDPENNKFYDVWVKQVDSKALFATSDLNPEAALKDKDYDNPVCSFLNSKFPAEQASKALLEKGELIPTPSWAKDLQLYITTGNLRGVPFCVSNFNGADDDLSDLRMTRHRDWIGFNTSPSKITGLQPLDLRSTRKSKNWDRVRQAMQATGTLPAIFPVAKVTAPVSSYTSKFGKCEADWPAGMPAEFTYDAVDGAIFRNTPLELVRMSMEAGSCEDVLTKHVDIAQGAVVLVDPSPSRQVYETDYSQQKCQSIPETLLRVLSSLIFDANFLDDEADAVKDENDLSRFMISPMRAGRAGKQEILATDTLHGFGGVIGKAQRKHDFQLGRRNAQRFLRSHFVVPLAGAKSNDIFGQDAEQFATDMGERGKVVQILPLFKSADRNCPTPVWPTFEKEARNKRRKELHDEITDRVNAVLTSFAVNWGLYRRGWCPISAVRNWFVTIAVGKICKHIMKRVDVAIETALNNF